MTDRFTYDEMQDDLMRWGSRDEFLRWNSQMPGLDKFGLPANEWEQELGMQRVTVRKGELVERMTSNMEKHRQMFLEAQEGYREAVIKALDERLADARGGKPVTLHFGLIPPEDHTGDYERVLDMLQMSVDDEIDLDAMSFAQFVRDEWAWRRQWVMSNAGYSETAAVEAQSYGG